MRIIMCKELSNTRLASGYGGWIYCEGCNKTIGYLCYVTYDSFKFEYNCKCGNLGSALLAFKDVANAELSDQHLTIIKNRLCCHEDQSPLVTILSKKLDSYTCEVVCKSCGKNYKEEGKLV